MVRPPGQSAGGSACSRQFVSLAPLQLARDLSANLRTQRRAGKLALETFRGVSGKGSVRRSELLDQSGKGACQHGTFLPRPSSNLGIALSFSRLGP